MALQAEQTVAQRVIALLLQQRDRQELALGFGHFAAGRIQMHDMHPVVAPVVADVAFRLRDLVGVVRERIVDAAAVDIQILAQILEGNAGALDVPAGIADAPGRIPLERLVLKLGLGEPEHKVVLVALVRVLFHALADADGEVFFLVLVENVVFFELGGIKVDVAALDIGIASIEQLRDDLDILVDAAGRGLDNIRPLDVELAAVVKEGIGIELGDLHDGLVLAAGALEHLVLALIGIGGQMADVGDVHDALDVIAGIAQVLFKNVLHDVRAEVSDVRKVIHSRAAGVHLDYIRMIGNKVLFLSCCRIIKLHN